MSLYYSDSMRHLDVAPQRPLVWLSLLLAMVLNLVPYPDVFFVYKPDFMALTLVYWCFRDRNTIDYISAFALGLLTDVAFTSTLGQHAFAYSSLIFVTDIMRNSYMIAGGTQQLVFVMIALAIALSASLSVSVVFDAATPAVTDLYPVIAGAIIWIAFKVIRRTLFLR